MEIFLCEQLSQPNYITDPGLQTEVKTALGDFYLLFNGEPFDPAKFATPILFKYYAFKKNLDLTEILSKLKILPVLNLGNDDFRLANNPLKRKIKHDSAIPIKNKLLVLKDNDPGVSMKQVCTQVE